MHLYFLLLALTLACTTRLLLHKLALSPSGHLPSRPRPWSDRWQSTLFVFLFPPLLLVVMAIAVLFMGVHGQMLGWSVGTLGYLLAVLFLLIAGGLLAWRMVEGWRSLHNLCIHPVVTIHQTVVRRLTNPLPFAAQLGFWQSQLVISDGLLNLLNTDQLNAVLTHEQAHAYYRDTFWFFWLGWVRNLTAWLPHTKALWEELLLLRELRADRWAAQRVDGLLLAETLLLMVKQPFLQNSVCAAAFESSVSRNRLAERIDALLESTVVEARSPVWGWFGFIVAATPLLTLILHRW